ncbi:MAG: nicotinate-nucleotide pyrophosphorylase (carboxylating) [Pseudohongiellaceae bacterium]|jgi:nicotinate-nucleotide pyrophosphorylase (carboxylating)
MQPTIPSLLDIQHTVKVALAEDVGSGDITASLIPSQKLAKARIVSRENAILCGQMWANETALQLHPSITIRWLVDDGEAITAGMCIAILEGPARSLLTAERTILNFLQTLSGTATKTRELVDLISHTDCVILDTRKTLPGLRVAQKYAVTAGGGSNHRLGLFDAYLIKENHIRACGSIELAIHTARQNSPNKPVEIEVQTLDELRSAIAAKADTVMLDNFSLALTREAVAINAGAVKLEASGNVDKETLIQIAETGVDYVSIGALTKHCRAIDFSMLFDSDN